MKMYVQILNWKHLYHSFIRMCDKGNIVYHIIVYINFIIGQLKKKFSKPQ